MNLFALLPLAGFLANMALGVYVLYRDSLDKVNRLYALFAFALAVWAIGEYFVLSSPTTETAFSWTWLSMLGAVLVPAFFLHFSLAFIKNRAASKRMHLAIIYLPALFFGIAALTTNLLAEAEVPSLIGYSVVTGPLYNLFAIYATAYVMSATVLCIRHYTRLRPSSQRTQTKLIIAAASIPLAGGVLLQVIPPFIGFDTVRVTSTLTVFMSVIVAYAMTRYGLMKPSSFSIQRKMTAISLMFMIIIGAVTVIVVGTYSRGVIEQQIYDHLETAAHSGAKNIETLLDGYRETAIMLSTGNSFRDAVDASKNRTQAMEQVNRRITNIIQTRGDISRIRLLDKHGMTIASSHEDVGYDRSGDDVFLGGMDSVYVGDMHISEFTGNPVLSIAAPVLLDGVFSGVIVMNFGSEGLFEITADAAVMGETGKIYLVNSERYIISPTGFLNGTFVEQRVDTENARNCFSTPYIPGLHLGHEPVTVFEDYRGIDVLGTHMHIPCMGWCLLAEIDAEEAFMPISNMQNSMLLAFIALTGIGGFLSFMMSRSFTRPIIKLRNAAKRVGEGKLSTRIEIKSGDEIGELAAAFKQMTNNLKESRKEIRKHASELEGKIKERTNELDEKVKETTATKTAVLNMMEDADIANRELIEAQGKLKSSLEKLEVVDVKKDEFISVAAHELKTPLTAIHGFSQLLRNEKIFRDKKKRDDYLKLMDKETKRLTSMVTEILELSRVDLGTMKLAKEKVSLKEIYDTVKKEMTLLAQDKGLRTHWSMDKELPDIVTDKEKVIQVMLNLVNNAVKYTDKGSIAINVIKDEDFVRFDIKDTGIGIPEEQFDKIFERFYQIDSSYTRKIKGTGLGLALCKDYVELLGGRIWVESHVGKGTTFHFTLPLTGPPERVMGKKEEIRKILRESEKARDKAKDTGLLRKEAS